MSDYTRQLAEFVANTCYDDIPADVVARAKVVMLDTLSCAVAGYTKAPEECGWILNFIKETGGIPESTVWLDGYRTSAMMAAMANSTMVHTVDFDDTHIDSIAHLGAGLLGTVLSLGEKVKATGKEVLTAFILGFDVGARAGNSVNKGEVHLHYKYWHPTATAGTIACAAAAAKLMKLDANAAEQAIGLGIDQACGLRYCIDKGDFSKSLHPGWAAMRGVMAAQMIAGGSSGPRGLLEYPTGFCNATCSEPKLELLTERLGNDYTIMRDALKMYPTIHGSHSGIEATLNIITKNDIPWQEIEKILIRLSPLAKGQGVNYQPDSVLAARLSLPCCMTFAAKLRRVTLNDFTEDSIKDSANLDFMKRVEVQPEPEFNRLYPDSGFTSEATVTLKDGREFKELVVYPKAHPQRPATEQDIKGKYSNLTGFTWTKDKADEVYQNFMHLENYVDIGQLVSSLQ